MTTQYPLQPFPICTLENYRLGLHFFEWAANETKYIMCSEYPGMGRLKDCAPYHKWSQMTTQYPLQPFPICTLENYRLGLHFFEWAANETKYIMCSEYPGMGRLKDCAPYHKWSQPSQACIYKDIVLDWTRDIYQTTPKADNYGCTPGLKDNSLFYHAHPYDNSKFIQCDEFGDAFILDCPTNEIWYQDVQNCLPGVRNVKQG
ncbi:collagen alpha-1(XIV) chain [Elysia marginata]|uniref:Collagen alpha-1(XIV) chain n=1 Tax=Elysia marginata TaxID=1093978 RepID=A0AAV4IFL3_9GAST|nr:collagen alpha-1(XIV) chain [Elysia marginata]